MDADSAHTTYADPKRRIIVELVTSYKQCKTTLHVLAGVSNRCT